MLGPYRDPYRRFTVRHFHEQLVKRHDYTLGYTVTKRYLNREGLVQRATKRSADRKMRPHRPMVGIMLHQDASPQAWLPGEARKYDVVMTMEAGHQRPATRPSWWMRRTRRTLPPGCWPVLLALHRPGKPLLLHLRGRRAGVEDGSDTGRALPRASLASRISRPTHHSPGAAPNVYYGCYRIVCQMSSSVARMLAGTMTSSQAPSPYKSFPRFPTAV